MPEKFKPKDDPEFPFMKDINAELFFKYKHKLELLELAINNNWSINKLVRMFPGEFAISLGNNSSGVDVAILDTMEVDGWTW
jgi:hypothetical protein